MTHWELFFWSFTGAFAATAVSLCIQRLGGWLYDRTHPYDPGDEP
jgi:hypothetical protein